MAQGQQPVVIKQLGPEPQSPDSTNSSDLCLFGLGLPVSMRCLEQLTGLPGARPASHSPLFLGGLSRAWTKVPAVPWESRRDRADLGWSIRVGFLEEGTAGANSPWDRDGWKSQAVCFSAREGAQGTLKIKRGACPSGSEETGGKAAWNQ